MAYVYVRMSACVTSSSINMEYYVYAQLTAEMCQGCRWGVFDCLTHLRGVLFNLICKVIKLLELKFVVQGCKSVVKVAQTIML